MASSSHASISARTVPHKYVSGVALMEYSVKDADLLLADSWITLDTAEGIPTGFNVSAIVFDHGVSITQKRRGNRCTLELDPQEYSDAQVVPGETETDSITITIRCMGPYKRRLEGDEAVAKEFPLAQLCGDSLGFEYIRLLVLGRKLAAKGGPMGRNVAAVIGQFEDPLKWPHHARCRGPSSCFPWQQSAISLSLPPSRGT